MTAPTLRVFTVGLLMLVGGAATVLGREGLSLADRLALLQRAYPDQIAGSAKNHLSIRGGVSLVIDDGARKDHQAKLRRADIEDMLSQVYPIGACIKGPPARNADPGRIRNEAFFRAIYGTSRKAVRRNLKTVDWFGRRLRFSAVAGAAKALGRVRAELAHLDKRFRKYFTRTAGTYNWRRIAGTKRLSVHSFGAAIDLNVDFADYWRWDGGKPGRVKRHKNRMPLEIVEIFERHGFIWGGKWYHYDTMHFEYRPALIAIAELSAKRGCAG